MKKTTAIELSIDTIQMMLEDAFLAGFLNSGEGYNGEFPFGSDEAAIKETSEWKEGFGSFMREALIKLQKPQ